MRKALIERLAPATPMPFHFSFTMVLWARPGEPRPIHGESRGLRPCEDRQQLPQSWDLNTSPSDTKDATRPYGFFLSSFGFT